MADDPNLVFTPELLIKVAMGEVGTTESPVNRTKYGEEYGLDGVFWCGIFIWWCFKHAGYDMRFHGFHNPASTNQRLIDAQKALGWKRVKDVDDARPGDLVLYDFGVVAAGDLPNDADHVGIVTSKVTDRHFSAVEGNTSGGPGSQHDGGGVFKKRRSVSQIKAVFRPPFESGAAAAAEEEDMFIATVPGPDKRAFVVGVKGKRLIPDPETFRALRAAGVPLKGDVSSVALSLFPTIG
jgi:hypothetical protein